MSTAACRRCDGLISFVLASNGRWRPVEAQYTALDLDEDEVTALRVEGNWTSQVNSEVRVYRYHRCPEDPSLCVGRARTSVVVPGVDPETGVVVDDEGVVVDDEPDDDDEPEPECELDRLGRRKDQRYEYACRRHAEHELAVDCPECEAQPKEPCCTYRDKGVRMAAHPSRCHVTAFMEEWDQPWPPTAKQRGSVALYRWLSQYGDVLTTPASRSTS